MIKLKLVIFILLIVAVAGSLWISTSWLSAKGLIDGMPSYTVEILALLAVSTVLIYYFLQKMKSVDPVDFIRNFLVTVVLKLLLSGALIIILIKLDPTGANANALFFMISYFLFTACEVTALTLKKNAE